LAHIYAMLIVVFLWVVFRASSLGEAVDYYSVMLGLRQSDFNFVSSDFWFYLGSLKLYLFLAVLFSFPIAPWLKSKFDNLAGEIAYIFIFLLCFMSVVKSGYNPFIYFNF